MVGWDNKLWWGGIISYGGAVWDDKLWWGNKLCWGGIIS